MGKKSKGREEQDDARMREWEQAHAYQSRTVPELRAYLQQHGIPEAEIEAAIAKQVPHTFQLYKDIPATKGGPRYGMRMGSGREAQQEYGYLGNEPDTPASIEYFQDVGSGHGPLTFTMGEHSPKLGIDVTPERLKEVYPGYHIVPKSHKSAVDINALSLLLHRTGMDPHQATSLLNAMAPIGPFHATPKPKSERHPAGAIALNFVPTLAALASLPFTGGATLPAVGIGAGVGAAQHRGEPHGGALRGAITGGMQGYGAVGLGKGIGSLASKAGFNVPSSLGGSSATLAYPGPTGGLGGSSMTATGVAPSLTGAGTGLTGGIPGLAAPYAHGAAQLPSISSVLARIAQLKAMGHNHMSLKTLEDQYKRLAEAQPQHGLHHDPHLVQEVIATQRATEPLSAIEKALAWAKENPVKTALGKSLVEEGASLLHHRHQRKSGEQGGVSETSESLGWTPWGDLPEHEMEPGHHFTQGQFLSPLEVFHNTLKAHGIHKPKKAEPKKAAYYSSKPEPRKYKQGGFIHDDTVYGHDGGQSDKVPTTMPEGSYVMDATTVSLLGDGNTHAGIKKLKEFEGKVMSKKSHSPITKEWGQSRNVKALLSPGERKVRPEVVAALGNGDNAKGAKVLDKFRDNLRKQKGVKTFLPPKSKPIEQYIKRGK